jgi:homoserine kinase
MNIEIAVPGSVANLGGGFDTLAVAVQLYLRARIVDVRADGGARLVVVNSRPPVSGDNIVERAFAAIARRVGGDVGNVVGNSVPSVFVEVDSDIPMAAGLGSSAAAAIAGVRVFEHVAGPVPESTLLAVAASIEGHADNAAASLLGGLTSVVETSPPSPHGGFGVAGPPSPHGGFGVAGTEVQVLRWRWPEDLRLIVATPCAGLATSTARAALAPSVSRNDAVFNLQRVLSLVHALQHGEYERLRDALQDRWHQPARAALVPHLGAALAIDDPDVLGACLSGAGPSVAVLARRDFARVERLLQAACEAAGSPVTVRTLAVHQSPNVMRDAMASAHGRTT